MARNMMSTTTLTLTINMQQANKVLEAFKKRLATTSNELETVREKLDDPSLWEDGETFQSLTKLEKVLSREEKSLKSVVNQTATSIKGIDEVLSNLSRANYNQLTKTRTTLTNTLKNLETDTKEYREAADRLQKVRDEINSRDVDIRGGMTRKRAQEVMLNLSDSSYSDIKSAIDVFKKLQSQVKSGGRQWADYGKKIADANIELKKWDDKSKRTQMVQLSKQDLSLVDNKDLHEQLRYWDGIINKGTVAGAVLNRYKNIYSSIYDELRKRGESTIDKVLGPQVDGASADKLQQQLKTLQEYRAVIDSTKPDAYVRVDEAIKQLTQNIKASQAGFISFEDAMNKAQAVADGTFEGTLEDLDKLQKVLKEGLSTEFNLADEKDLEQLKQAQVLLDGIAKKQQEIARLNTREKVAQVQTNLSGTTTGEIDEAVKMAKELQKVTTDKEEFKQLAVFIGKAEQQLREWTEAGKQASMEGQIKDLSAIRGLSKSALEEQTKFWQGAMDGAKNSSQAYKEAHKHFLELQQESKRRLQFEGEQVINQINLGVSDGSAQQMQERLKTLQEYRAVIDGTKPDAYVRVDEAIKQLTQNIKASQAGFISFEDAMNKAQAVADGTFEGTLEDLDKLQKVLKEGLSTEFNLADEKDLEQLKQAQVLLDGIAKKQQEIARLNTREKVAQVQTNLSGTTTGEIDEAVKMAKELQKVTTDKEEFKQLAVFIGKAEQKLREWTEAGKQASMERQLSHIGSLSKSALAEQKKFWQAAVDGAAQGSSELTQYEANLKKVNEQQKALVSQEGKGLVDSVLTDSWSGTIKDAEEAIKQIENYKQHLSTDADPMLFQQANDAISSLTEKIEKAKDTWMDIADAKNVAKEIGEGSFKGLDTDIEKARKALEAYRHTLNLGTQKAEIKEVDEALSALAASAQAGSVNLKSLDEILANLKHSSMNDLQSAAARLKEELKRAERGTKDYVETSKQLQQVNKEIERVNHEWEGQESLFIRMTKRLSVYMAAYGSLSAITGYIKEIYQANLKLSDSIADVEKTTGLTSEKLAQLGEDIKAIDTRTAQEQLYELAAAAGQLGIKSENEIAGFVRAANMITVSLNELGTEATTQLMKIATLTGEAQEGTEKALLSIGSSINELTANSAAAAAPIVDLMNRMGGVASQAGITSAEMAAIGATADALGQSVEITGTSMNKFLTTLTSNSDQIAYALNMDAQALRSLINAGDTMGAVVAIFERMNDMGGLGKLAPIMGELGSEGARMTQVLAALAGRVDLLKAQLEISNSAYEDAVSIQNEYNVKNENAIAILQRMGNAVKEVFVNNVAVDGITAFLRAVYNVGVWLKEATFMANTCAAAIVGLTAALIANKTAWIQAANAKGIKGLIASLKSGTSAVSLFGKRMLSIVTSGKRMMVVLRQLWSVITANPITAITAAIAAAGTALVKWATYVSDITKATARYNRELQEETNKVDLLFNSLKRLNNTQEDKARIINQINQQYGSYLGYMLHEQDSAEKLAAAHQLINAELKKRMALNLQSTLEGTASNAYAEQLEKTTTKIGQVVKGEGMYSGGKWVNKVSQGEVSSLVEKAVNTAIDEAIIESQDGKFRELGKVNVEQLLDSIAAEMSESFDIVDKEGNKEVIGKFVFANIKSNIEDLIEARKNYMEGVLNAERTAQLEIGRITQEELNARKEWIDATQKELQSLGKQTGTFEKTFQDATAAASKYLRSDESIAAKEARAARDKAENDLRKHYEQLIHNANSYVKSVQTLMEEHNSELTEQDKKTFNKRIASYQKNIKDLSGKMPGLDPWGKGRDVKDWKEFTDIITNIDTSSATALAAAYKKITEDTAKIPDNVEDFYEMFRLDGVDPIGLEQLGLTDATSVAKQVHDWAEQIKDKLKTKYGRNTSLGFIFEDDSNKNKKIAQQMYKEWLAELDAYYNERETLIRQRGQEQNKLESEINRELEALNSEKLRAQRELEEGLLKDQASKSTFDPKSYIGPITNTKYFADMTLEQMRAIVSAGGTKLDAEIRKNLTDRMVKLEEQAYKIKQRIEKILLEDDFSAQVAEEYLKALDELGLLFNIETEAQTEMSREAGEARLAYMREWSKDAYNLTAETLEKEMRQNELFNAWVEGREPKHYEALLVQLRKFHDDQIEADKKAADRRKKILDASKKGQDLREQGKTIESAAQTRVDQEEKDVKMWERFQDLDLVSEDFIDEKQIEVGEAQIKLYNAKIAASQAYIAQMQWEMEVERQKADATIASIKEQLANTSLSNEQRNELNAQLVAAEQHKQSLLRQEEMMTEQARNNILEAETERTKTYQEIADRYVSIEQRKVGEVKKYTDALVSFSGQMGEAAWGEVEDRQEAGKQLIKSLLTTLKDWATVKLTELAMQQMFANQSNAISGGEMIKNLTAEGAEATGSVAIAGVKGTADSVSKMGLTGLLVGAAISAALSALLGVAMGKLNKKKAEIASITKASSGGKLATGMLTYAEGNYPVLGNDGKVYDAKYEGAGMKTGIYRGGAHFGIFSEKKPEAIIDGDTTQRLILNHPDIWKAIVTLSKTGRLDRGMATFATGNIEQLTKQATQTASSVTALPSPEVAQMQAALENNNRVIAQLSAILANGIQAKMDMYGPKGAYNNMKKAEKFAVRRGI